MCLTTPRKEGRFGLPVTDRSTGGHELQRTTAAAALLGQSEIQPMLGGKQFYDSWIDGFIEYFGQAVGMLDSRYLQLAFCMVWN